MASALKPVHSPEAIQWLCGRLDWEQTLGRLRSPEPVETVETVFAEELGQAA